MFLYWTQAPSAGPGSVSSPLTLKDKRECQPSAVRWSVLLPSVFLTTTYSRWEALLKCSLYGEATVVEVPDELWVNGATELSHLPVSRSDEDALDGLHENVVEQGVLCS